MKTILVQNHRKLRIELSSELAEAVAHNALQQNLCPLCHAHPSSGHSIGCALVKDALFAGKTLEQDVLPTESDGE